MNKLCGILLCRIFAANSSAQVKSTGHEQMEEINRSIASVPTNHTIWRLRLFIPISFVDSVTLVTVVYVMLAFLNESTASGHAPPNFVLIYADDVGYADLGCYGNEYHETPNIDRLMADGLRFTQAYADAPLCAPSRVALLTGRHCARAGCYDVFPKRIIEGVAPEQVDFVPPENIWNLPAGRTILPEYLKQIGYRTGCFGKWHVGPMMPGKRGFDEFVSLRTTSHTDVSQSLIGRSKGSPKPERLFQ